jgi:hypothetical protein
MPSFFTGLFLGVILGWLTVGCLVNEEVRGLLRYVLIILIRILAVIACALAVGLIVLTTVTLALESPSQAIVSIPQVLQINSPGEVYGVAAVLLVGGVFGLVLSFLGRKRRPTDPQEIRRIESTPAKGD